MRWDWNSLFYSLMGVFCAYAIETGILSTFVNRVPWQIHAGAALAAIILSICWWVSQDHP